MMAGRMRYWLRVLKPTVTVNGYGEEAIVWEESATIHAERETLSGRQRDAVDEHFPAYSVRYNVRDAHEVEERWRVEEVGGHLYTVTNIIPNWSRGMNTLVCERVNE